MAYVPMCASDIVIRGPYICIYVRIYVIFVLLHFRTVDGGTVEIGVRLFMFYYTSLYCSMY